MMEQSLVYGKAAYASGPDEKGKENSPVFLEKGAGGGVEDCRC